MLDCPVSPQPALNFKLSNTFRFSINASSLKRQATAAAGKTPQRFSSANNDEASVLTESVTKYLSAKFKFVRPKKDCKLSSE